MQVNKPAVNFYSNNFDLIRIVTAFLVLINHSLAHLKLPIPFWYTIIQQFQRVPMFFVMSGFLLSASFERNSDLTKYFRNRMARIYPGLWVCLILTIVLFWVTAQKSFLEPEAIPWLLAQMAGFIYTPGFLQSFGYGSYNGSLWTIVVELQFYIVLPIIYILYKNYSKTSNNKLFYLLFIVSILLAWFLRSNIHLFGGRGGMFSKLLRYSFLPYAYIFMTGILLQRLKIWQWKIIRGKALYWMAAFLIFKYLMPIHSIGDMIGMIILACCTVSLGYSMPGIASRYLKRDLSYGVYLYHGMLLSILVELGLTGNFEYFILVAAITSLLAWLSYVYIESPAINWAKVKAKKDKKPAEPLQVILPAKIETQPNYA